MRTPDFSKVAMQARDTIQTNAPGPSISDNVDAGTIRLGGLELSYAEAIYAIGCIIAIIGSILPFFTFSAGAGGQATLQMSVNLIARGFWWLLVAWIAAGVTMHKGYPAAGIASGGFTVVFCIFFLVGWIMNGTTPGIGAFVIMLGGLVMLAGSIARTRPDLATSVRRTKAAAPQGRMSNVTTHETAPASEAQPEQIKICPACGSEEDADAKFCGNCGSKLS